MKFFRRKKERAWESLMTREQLEMLARYNGRVSRGIVHTAEYKERMAKLQQLFDIAAKRSITPD